MTTVPAGAIDTELGSARRNVALLTAAQAILGSAPPIVFAVGALAAHQMLAPADEAYATAPLTGFNVGTAAGTILVAILARYLSRRPTFIFGALLLGCGGMLAAVAIFESNFWLLLAGMLITGVAAGFTQKFRFAAADASPSFYKSTAISWILAGGVISGILGPQLSIYTQDLFAPVAFAGAFVMFAPLAIVAAIILTFLKLPPMHEARLNAAEPARPLADIVLKRRFLIGMYCGIASYALMTFMMTGAPLAMVYQCGFDNHYSTQGIQYHVLGMFAPSFFTGRLIRRFGAERIVATGLVILMVCAVIAHMGVALWNFWGALILLGCGWNFGFIGGTAIIAQSYRLSEADKVQGFHDIVLFSTVALSSFTSGQIFSRFGWDAMILPVWPLAIIGLILLFFLSRSKQRPETV